MQELVRLALLGPLAAARGDEQVDLGPAKQRAVLAVLLLHPNRSVGADTIVDAVWPERPPANGRNVVSKYVGRLRRLLGGVIDRTDLGYVAVADHLTLDLLDFHRRIDRAVGLHDNAAAMRTELTEALSLWRGPALSGLTGPFFDAARHQLAEQRLAALEERVEIDMALGTPAGLVVELTEQVALHPLRERLAGQLMRALHRYGRQADAIAVFHGLRDRLADELGIDPGREICALYERLLRNEEEPPADLPAPAQLSHDIPDFTGRTAELTELLAADASPIRVITGIAGVGKTALALHAAHRMRSRFPDGQLYVDLRGFDAEHSPLAPVEALGRFLTAMGVPAQLIPADTDERAALYRSAIAGKRLLLMLDNAASPDQVRPLLPGTATTVVLVTSRSTLTGLSVREGAHRITLSALPPGDAVALVSRIVGQRRATAEPAAVAELAELCGYLPLALRIAGQRVVGNPGLALAELARELAAERLDVLVTEGDETSAVRAAFSWSYQSLAPELARAFRLLGLHSTPEFGLQAAAALLGVDADRARRLLGALSGGHLLQDNGKGRYQYHDLMRAYAVERAVAEESDRDCGDAVRRCLTWYVSAASAAGEVLVPHRQRAELDLPADVEPEVFRSMAQALEWYETEHANLVAVQRQAVDLGERTIAWQLPVAMWDFFYLRSQWTDWIGTHELGLTAVRATGDRVGEAGVLTSLGHAYLEVGRLDDALAVTRLGLSVWREVGHRWGEGIAVHILGGVHQAAGRLHASVEHYRRALTVHTEIDNQWGIGWTLAVLGTAYHSLGDYEPALDTLRQARSVWQDLGDRYGEGFVLNDLGETLLELGRFGEAVEHYRLAAELNREIGNEWSEAMALTGLGDAMRTMGQPDAAAASWRDALAIMRDLGDPRAESLRSRLAGLRPPRRLG
jgi:DNA-binding SARP family transcriptional activator